MRLLTRAPVPWVGLATLLAVTVFAAAPDPRVAVRVADTDYAASLALDIWSEHRGADLPLDIVVRESDLPQLAVRGIAWEWSSRGVARLKEGEEKATALRDAAFNSKLLWRKLFSKVECVGSEQVNGSPAWKVVLTPEEGRPATSLFDAATGLLVKSVHVIATPDGDVLSENTFGGYKPVAGVLMAHLDPAACAPKPRRTRSPDVSPGDKPMSSRHSSP